MGPYAVNVLAGGTDDCAREEDEAPHPGIGVYTHPVDALHVSVVQAFASLQLIVAPPWQAPPEQASPDVQALESEQAAVLFVYTQPVELLQESFVHGLESLQVIAAWEHPADVLQVSVVQALESLQLTEECWHPAGKK